MFFISISLLNFWFALAFIFEFAFVFAVNFAFTFEFELIQLIENVWNLRYMMRICQIQSVHQAFCCIVNCVVYVHDYFNWIWYFSTSDEWFIRFSFSSCFFCIFLCNVRWKLSCFFVSAKSIFFDTKSIFSIESSKISNAFVAFVEFKLKIRFVDVEMSVLDDSKYFDFNSFISFRI